MTPYISYISSGSNLKSNDVIHTEEKGTVTESALESTLESALPWKLCCLSTAILNSTSIFFTSILLLSPVLYNVAEDLEIYTTC